MTREEALNEIRSWAIPSEKGREVLETLIPELAESEDERMVVKIARTLSFAAAHNLITDYDELLAMQNWLEKQKELFESGRGLYYYDGEKTIYCGDPATAENPFNFAISQHKRQKECLADNSKTSASEDERTRKTLIEALKTSKTVGELKFILPEPTREEAIAYLEKQKDLDKMIVVSPEVWDNTISDAYENGKKDGEKQKEQKPYEPKNWPADKDNLTQEQKPAEWSAKGRRGRIGTTPEHIRKKAENFLSKMEPPYDANDICTAYEAGALESAKPAEWSEEDEKRLELVIDCVYEYYPDPVMKYKLKDWLKSLPERFNLQPKQEWSEEDQKIYDDIMSALEKSLNANRCYFTSYDVDFLKLLRPQPKKELSIEKAIQWLDDTFCFLDNSSGRGRDCEITTHDFDSLEEMYDSFRKAVTVDSEPSWKPSEEQMNALKNSAYGTYQNGDGPVLRGLYEQLLKLGVK